MNAVELYNNIFNFNVAELNLEELKSFLEKHRIGYSIDMDKVINLKSIGFVYPKGTYHISQFKDKLVIGDNYFFKCENINGEEIVEWQCPYWAQHTDHQGVCDMNNEHIPNGVTYDDMEDDRWEHCEMCPYHDEYQNRAAEAEGEVINDELMQILFFCMCEYKYSGILFTPVNFTIADYEGSEHDPEYYYCYNTENKVAIAYNTDNINPSNFLKAIEGHDRIHNAYTAWRQYHRKALQTYGLNNIPDNYKAQVCAWLEQNVVLREHFYTSY